MSKHISCATTVLNDEKTAIDEIDRVLQGALRSFHVKSSEIDSDSQLCFSIHDQCK